MNIVLSGDIFNNVIKQLLVPIDLYNLIMTCKYYSKHISEKDFKDKIINEMDRRLLYIFGDDYTEFKKIMHVTRSNIIGSFVIQCILGEYWEDEIDICTDIGGLSSFLMDKKKGYYKDGSKIRANNPIILDKLFFSVNGYDIKLIYVRTGNVFRYVSKTCKFNVCKTMCQYLEDMSTYDLRVDSISDIANRYTNIYVKYKSYDDDFKKYYNKGFSFYLIGDEKKSGLSAGQMHDILCHNINVNVKQIESNNLCTKLVTFCQAFFAEQNDEINLGQRGGFITIINNEICNLKMMSDGNINRIRLYKICDIELANSLYVSQCDDDNVCVTKLLLPGRQHLHSDIGVLMLTKKYNCRLCFL